MVTFAQGYDPYGVVTLTKGAGQSAYGFTGEQQGASGLVYLRARYYNPADGRFQSRDTWEGDINVPLSLNLWNYGHANPVNLVDPTGHHGRIPCPSGWDHNAVKQRVDEAEKYVYHTSDPIDTYTAAGIAIQCAGTDSPLPNSGTGIAQISRNQAETEWGVEIDIFGTIRGYGLRLCVDGELEEALDPNNPQDAVVLMKRRIQQVTNRCLKCNSTDIFIAAGLAQNGPGFNWTNMKDLVNGVYGKRLIPTTPNGATLPWQEFWRRSMPKNTSIQLWRFTKIIRELQTRRWIVPDVDWVKIEDLSK